MNDPSHRVNNLVTATELVREALEGSVSAGERLGLRTKIIGDTSADIAARAKEFATQLNTIYGGQNLAEYQNFSAQFSAAWNNIKEVIGESLTPFFDGVFKDATDFLTGLIESGEIQKIGRGLAYWTELTFEFTKGIFEFAFEAIPAIAKITEGYFKFFYNLLKALIRTIPSLIMEAFSYNPIANKLLNKLGIDTSEWGFGKTIKKDFDDIADSLKISVQGANDLLGAFTGSNTKFDDMAKGYKQIGAEARKAAEEQLKIPLKAILPDDQKGLRGIFNRSTEQIKKAFGMDGTMQDFMSSSEPLLNRIFGNTGGFLAAFADFNNRYTEQYKRDREEALRMMQE